jgi:hypothetical protein
MARSPAHRKSNIAEARLKTDIRQELSQSSSSPRTTSPQTTSPQTTLPFTHSSDVERHRHLQKYSSQNHQNHQDQQQPQEEQAEDLQTALATNNAAQHPIVDYAPEVLDRRARTTSPA